MNVCFAPMEGITGYVFRGAHHHHYGHIHSYYTPFIAPNQTRRFTSRERNDILPEHNWGIPLVPQLLTNKADDFLWAAGQIGELGYREVNLNLGCPSGTVAAKGRGAGFLAFPEELDRFLETVSRRLEPMGLALSVKTRIGKESPAEWDRLLDIFNRYPLKCLIVHPRVQTSYYRGQPDWQAFRLAVEKSRHPLCYNGNLFSEADLRRFTREFPQIDTVMMGRGLLTNPALGEMAGAFAAAGESAPQGLCCLEKVEKETCPSRMADADRKQRLRLFHDEILAGYREIISGDKNVLFKMKELWYYLGDAFPGSERLLKKIRKAGSLAAYEDGVDRLFAEGMLEVEPVFADREK